MIEEFVDCTVIEIGKFIFEYMHCRSTRLVEGFNPAKGKGPVLLRTTNELKRRLSRETDAAFIGRIMIFISLLLPPWERGGVNLTGKYNVDSITKYDEQEEDENKMVIDVDEDEDSTGIPRSGWANSDSFYSKFWSLQKYLKNPVVLHSQEVLDEFKLKLDFVVNKFFGVEQERLKLRGQAINKPPTDHKMDIVVGSEKKSQYYPGFLKSRQLFDLQVPLLPTTLTKDGRF
jgi:THO complex subunit 1 transcription elongation factor